MKQEGGQHKFLTINFIGLLRGGLAQLVCQLEVRTPSKAPIVSLSKKPLPSLLSTY